MPFEKEIYEKNKTLIENRTELIVDIFAVNNKEKHDPKGISKKAKPGKPGILIE